MHGESIFADVGVESTVGMHRKGVAPSRQMSSERDEAVGEDCGLLLMLKVRDDMLNLLACEVRGNRHAVRETCSLSGW